MEDFNEIIALILVSSPIIAIILGFFLVRGIYIYFFKKNKAYRLKLLIILLFFIAITGLVIIISLSSACCGNESKVSLAISEVSSLGTEFIICYDEQAVIVGPETPTGGTASEWVCKVAQTDDVAKSGHTVIWPTLSKTKYCYSQDGINCITAVGNGAVLTSPFRLCTNTAGVCNTTDVMITCTFSATKNLWCNVEYFYG